MANAGRGLEKKDSSLMFREISPPHKWDQDLHSHYLRLTLPGFASAYITLHMDKYGHLAVRGSHQISEHKYVSFEETFNVPDDADLELAGGMFEEKQVYCVTIPKSNKLGQTNGSNSEGVKFDDHNKDNDKRDEPMLDKHGVGTLPNEPSRPSSVISSQRTSMKKIVFFVAILVAIYAAWLNREVKN